jgi:hypothetical protein
VQIGFFGKFSDLKKPKNKNIWEKQIITRGLKLKKSTISWQFQKSGLTSPYSAKIMRDNEMLYGDCHISLSKNVLRTELSSKELKTPREMLKFGP